MRELCPGCSLGVAKRERERKIKDKEPFSKSEMHNNHKRNTNRSDHIKIT
jgi:hypothetical protein